jgi:DNA-binding NtrC family response regulator
MSKLILLIDDDKLPMKYYTKALEESGFAVEHFVEPDGALKFMEKNKTDIDMVVLDIMMPSGKTYKEKDTKMGLTTGLFLFKDIKSIAPKVPVIVLTNVRNPETLNEFPKECLFQKMNTPPFKLVEIIAKNIGGVDGDYGYSKET